MSDRVRLILASFLMLFCELVLIRWAGSNVVYLSYFSNFVLLGSFLGIGIGFLRARSHLDLFRWAPVIMTFFIGFVLVFPVSIDRSGSALIYFGSLHKTGLPMWAMLPAVFSAVAVIMACVAQGVARLFSRFEPLEAYRYDILGSVFGIAGFSLLSFLGTGPFVWGLVIGAVLLLLLPWPPGMVQGVAVVGMIALFAVGSRGDHVIWSPYYRIDARAFTSSNGDLGYQVSVNGIPHQTILAAAQRERVEPPYVVPYQRVRNNLLDDVLIVGAGNGSDVAIALRHGAQHVDAVEIDPELLELGRRLNPDHPYADPDVTAIVNDGRAYLERTDRTYDLILFALPDSLTLVSGQSALRLESYLFTREAMTSAAEHLKPGGAFGMYNYYRETWLVDRLAGTLAEVYGRAPCIDISTFEVGDGIGRFSVLMAAPDAGALRCDQRWSNSGRIVPPPATDDHPFVYLRTRTIPGLYLTVLALVLLASLLLVRAAGGPFSGMRSYLDLFFMGAAFLLLETKNVVQFALLFGTTWFVNALVFGGILLVVLAAVETARRVRVRRAGFLWIGLAVSVALAWLVPTDALLGLAVVPRFVAATALAFTPIFLANLIFAERFREVGESTVAFGANLLGAMVGGVIEYLSLVIGFRSLLLVTAALYGLAYVLARPHMGAGAGSAHAPQEQVPAGAAP